MAALLALKAPFGLNAQPPPAPVISLDGPGWLLATDPKNVGQSEKWQEQLTPGAKLTKVPWIIQDAFPGYHGVAWYWREFVPPSNPHPGGRHLLRFWAVDYKADVYLNGQPAGSHEGGETPFTLDVTESIRPGQTNRLAVRVLNPTPEPIDGIVLNETPHRNKALPYAAGSAWDQGGIIDSVELLVVPAVRVEDLSVRPNWQTGDLHIQANLRNAGRAVGICLEFTVAPAGTGETIATWRMEQQSNPGDTLVETTLHVPEQRLWELNDPYLYRVTVRVWLERTLSFHEQSVRCGFRDFRFQNGFFRLNGRRLYLRCSHTGNCCPIGLELPYDPDWLRRDLLNVKVMGFNAIRFIAGIAKRYQLDLCDEIGLLVYEESYAGWCLADSPRMAARYDESVLGMVRRDRNHPSVAMWGLLNETPDGPVFRHAVALLPRLRELDDTRLVMLNSGRWDVQAAGAVEGLEAWRTPSGPDPNVTHNPLKTTLSAPWATWQPGQMAFHPGPNGEFSAVRWTAPDAGDYEVAARFFGPDNRPTTEVHVLHNGRALFDGWLNLHERGNTAAWKTNLAISRADRVDFVVGVGNGNYGGDTTGLEASLSRSDGQRYDAASAFSRAGNPNGPWSYGCLAPGARPDAHTFAPYQKSDVAGDSGAVGSLANPGSSVWEDVLSDQHPYQRVPHTADIIRKLRSLSGGRRPVFISEYGIGSAVDLARAVRHYERLGKEQVEDARFYGDKLERFLADWQRWHMEEVFGRPEDFFTESLKRMAGQRLLGLNAIRANPNAVGYSLTGTVDQGMSGEGLFTTFRELKPGTVDALFDGWAPLRWCLFVEPVNVYRGARLRLEAILANEDALSPGAYPARLQVFGPGLERLWTRQTNVIIKPSAADSEPPFALRVLSEEIAIDGPPGRYRFVAAFERGAAATGGETEFYVADPAQLPTVETEVVVWGEDAGLTQWLDDHRIKHRAWSAAAPAQRELILAAQRPPAPGGAAAFAELARRVAHGSTAVFLSPGVFAGANNSAAYVPLIQKGSLSGLNSWLYHKDEWAKAHPVFEGLPTGMLDYTFYRELVPDTAWCGQEPPAEAVCGANDASLAYSAGLMLRVDRLGGGCFILNTLRIRENLGAHPAADRLLLNLLRYGARDLRKPLLDLPADFDRQLKALGYLP
jgi:hypothetical protein